MNQIFTSALSWLKSAGAHLLAGFGTALSAEAQTAATDLDGLVTKYTPEAVKVVSALENAVMSSSEKKSTAWTQLAQQLETDGHSIEADGFEAFVNLLVELGVNLVKVATGQSLSAPPAK
jgi:predicted alpha/beta hydrolase family esterase